MKTRMTHLWRALVLTAIIFLGVWGLMAQGPDYERLLQLARQRYGEQAVRTIRDWQKLIADANGLDDPEKIERVNDFFNNRVRYRGNNTAWGDDNYWATPLELMGRGQMDCKSFAIAKYETLKILSVPTERMRLIYVRIRISGFFSDDMLPHMVLGYYPSPDADPLILDNLDGAVRPASKRGDLFPIFSFNSDGLWVGKTSGSGSTHTGAARLSKWQDVIARMQAEGFE
jgi:predicted transglutaminase-like cysteine proteinase